MDMPSTGKLYKFWIFGGKIYLIMFASSLKTGYNHLKEGFESLKGKVTEQ